MKYVLVFYHDGFMCDENDWGGISVEIFDSMEKAVDFIAIENIPHMKNYFGFSPLYLFKSNSNHLGDTIIKEAIQTRKSQIIKEKEEEVKKNNEELRILMAKNEYAMYLSLKEKYENVGD